MRTAILLASVSALAFSPAAHADGPSHVKVTACSPLVRQDLLTIVGHPLVIALPPGESAWMVPMSGKTDPTGGKPVEPTVEGVKADDLQKQPVRNLVTLWPDAAGITTLTVVAQTADNIVKTYPFTIRAVPDGDGVLGDPEITLNLICKNGGVVAAPATHVAAVSRLVVPVSTRRIAPKAEVEEKLRTDAFNGPGTDACHYHGKGKLMSPIEPMCPMDNGQWTLMRFKGLTRKPAVYIGSCEDGTDKERLARQHESGDFVVIEEIAPQFCLRLGSDPNGVIEIVNDAYDPAGNDPGTGTISPSVRRDLIQAKAR